MTHVSVEQLNELDMALADLQAHAKELRLLFAIYKGGAFSKIDEIRQLDAFMQAGKLDAALYEQYLRRIQEAGVSDAQGVSREIGERFVHAFNAFNNGKDALGLKPDYIELAAKKKGKATVLPLIGGQAGKPAAAGKKSGWGAVKALFVEGGAEELPNRGAGSETAAAQASASDEVLAGGSRDTKEHTSASKSMPKPRRVAPPPATGGKKRANMLSLFIAETDGKEKQAAAGAAQPLGAFKPQTRVTAVTIKEKKIGRRSLLEQVSSQLGIENASEMLQNITSKIPGMGGAEEKAPAASSEYFEEAFRVPVYSVDLGLTDAEIQKRIKSQEVDPLRSQKIASLKHSLFESGGRAEGEVGAEGDVMDLIPGYAYGKILSDEKGRKNYFVIEPNMSDEERGIIETVKNALIQVLTIEELNKEMLFKRMEDIIRKKHLSLSPQARHKLVYYLSRDLLGLGKIEPLMHDPLIEDIELDGVNLPVYVIHKKGGHLATNIAYNNLSELEDFIIKMAQLSKSYVSYANPLLNAILPDGSRVNAVLTSSVSTRGPSFTIRLFPEKPLSPIALVQNRTVSPEMMAYLWTMLEFHLSIMITGPTAGGKTTMLNSLAMFIPHGQRVVSIEDTRELNLQHENWLPQVARPGFGPPDSAGKRFGEVDMMQLIRESFRQRPDYLVVGEVRGKETFVLFQGMASGHTSLATMHARSVNDVVSRLTTPPINLSPSLLDSVDLIINMGLTGEEGIRRRLRAVAEIKGYDVHEQRLKYVDLVQELKSGHVMHPKVEIDTRESIKQLLPISQKSIKMQQVSQEYSIPLSELQNKIDARAAWLEQMVKENVVDFELFLEKLKEYRFNERKIG